MRYEGVKWLLLGKMLRGRDRHPNHQAVDSHHNSTAWINPCLSYLHLPLPFFYIYFFLYFSKMTKSLWWTGTGWICICGSLKLATVTTFANSRVSNSSTSKMSFWLVTFKDSGSTFKILERWIYSQESCLGSLECKLEDVNSTSHAVQ